MSACFKRFRCGPLALSLACAIATACLGDDDVEGPSFDGGEALCDPDAGAGGGCEAGRACIEHADSGVFACSEECQSELCGDARRECNEYGQCERRDNCGFFVACEDQNAICDPFADECYPRTGVCPGCPQFSDELRLGVQIDCREERCRLRVRERPIEWLSEGTEGTVRIVKPSESQADAAFSAGEDLTFSWDVQRAPVLIRVLDRVPDGTYEYEAAVVWGASAEPGAMSVKWSEGTTRLNGEWIEGTPDSAEPGIYYLSILAVMSGRTVRVSPFRPFVVGEPAIARPGHPCIDGRCENPWLPLTCHAGTCARLCASHLDCGTARCGDTWEGRRMCGVNVQP